SPWSPPLAQKSEVPGSTRAFYNRCCARRFTVSRTYWSVAKPERTVTGAASAAFFCAASMFEQPLKFFVVFFVVVEPISLIPLFSGLTTGATSDAKRRMAVRAVLVAAAILVLFALGGAAFLHLMGISLEAFRIFGGMLLFLLSLEMVFARESGTRTSTSEAA